MALAHNATAMWYKCVDFIDNCWLETLSESNVRHWIVLNNQMCMWRWRVGQVEGWGSLFVYLHRLIGVWGWGGDAMNFDSILRLHPLFPSQHSSSQSLTSISENVTLGKTSFKYFPGTFFKFIQWTCTLQRLLEKQSSQMSDLYLLSVSPYSPMGTIFWNLCLSLCLNITHVAFLCGIYVLFAVDLCCFSLWRTLNNALQQHLISLWDSTIFWI